MSSRKGQCKQFDSGVIASILSRQQGIRLDATGPVTMRDVAEINEHLLPRSGVCMGTLVGIIAVQRSRPEIIRQCRRQLRGLDIGNASWKQLIGRLGLRTTLTCTGR